MKNIHLNIPTLIRTLIIKVGIFFLGIYAYYTIELVAFFFENFIQFLFFIGMIFLINIEQPFVLKNFFIIYSAIFFSIGGYFFFPEKHLYIDMLIYICSFLTGYSFSFYKESNFSVKDKITLPIEITKKYIIFIIFIISTILIVNIIMAGGLSSYYSKDFFSERLENYGKKDFSSGLNTIISFTFSISNICFIAIYVDSAFQAKKKINYWYLIYLLLLYPLLSLSRATFVFGILTLIYIYSVDDDRKGIFNKKLILTGFIALSLLMLVVIGIGTIRQEKFNDSGKGNIDLQANNKGSIFIFGELVNIKAYQWIKEETEKNGYQYGKTMFAPFILKMVPRSWYPDKPINSGAYFSEKDDPESYYSGFMIPSSFFGDAYLNFGLLGTIIFCVILGYVFGILDKNYIKGNMQYLTSNIIVYYYFYPLIRDELSDAFFLIAMSLFIITLLNRFLKNQSIKY